jgi:hypothetical protein
MPPMFKGSNTARDTLYTQLNQLMRGVSGIVAIVLIPIFLSKEQQGYWFTMTSIGALALLAELGFFQVTLQFAAHEFAFLRFENSNITGDDDHRARLATLFVFCTKWAFYVTIAAYPIIFAIGLYFLSGKTTNVAWGIPWAVYLFGGAITFFTCALFSFLEGCNSVAAIQRQRLIVALIAMIVMAACLIAGFGLHSLSLSMLAGAFYGIIIVNRRYGRIFHSLVSTARTVHHSWHNHIVSLLWRYGLTWGPSFFIFQIYPPLTFHLRGPVEAGRVGLSIMLWMGVYAVSNSWIYAVTPRFNMLVSKRDWQGLDRLFARSLILSAGTFSLAMAVVLVFIYLFHSRYSFIDRFSDPLSMLFLGIIWLFQIVVNGLATYLRAHKKEPLVLPSLLAAVYIVATTIICATYLPQRLFFLGWLSSCVWVAPWVSYIFRMCRRTWHNG